MYQTNQNKRSLRSSLLLGAASAAALATVTPALAQDTSVETVVVTGSRIPQQGLYSSSPVTAVGQQEAKFEGTTDVTSLLNNLPEAFVDQNSGVSNGSSGTANVDLRGLGSKRTLVLIDGTRLMPGDISDPVPDLNDIPTALVDHVEVLTGGASAVYGSDALAGVVNFVMRKDFEGVEVDGTYSVNQADNGDSYYRGLTQDRVNTDSYGFAQSKEGVFDGQNDDITLLMGQNSADGKGNITAYAGYRNVQAVLEGARDYSECTQSAHQNSAYAAVNPSAYTGGVACSGSSNYNRFLSYDNLFHDFYAPPATASAAGYDFFETPDTGHPTKGATFADYTGAGPQQFNYGALNYLQRPDTRYTGGYFGDYQVNKALDFYSNFMFADDQTVAQIAPSGLFLGSGTGFSGSAYINCSNPLLTPSENYDLCGQIPGDAKVTTAGHTYYNGAGNTKILIPGTGPGTGTAAEYFNPGAVPGQAQLLIGRRDIEGGDRQDDIRHTSYRIQTGVKGDLGDGWTYDVYGQYGLTAYQENYTGEFSKARVQNALEVDPATGACYATEPGLGGTAPSAPNCVPLNIFDGTGSITPAQLAYVGADGLKEGFTKEEVVSGSLTGDLGAWGGQSPWAKTPIGVSVGAEYREESLKLITDQEFQTNDLYGQGAATLSVPQSGFNVAEGFTEVSIPIAEGLPFIENLTANGGYRYSSYSTAGSTNTYKYGLEWQPIDDIRVRGSISRAVRAPNVLELFAPANVELTTATDPCASSTAGACATVRNAGNGALLTCPATQCNAEVSGNASLKPETSQTHTVGVVLTPTFLDGFTATVDYFDIKVQNVIGSIPVTETLAECYGPGATAASESFFCPFVHRNGAGQIWGTGYVSSTDLNTGYLKTTGIDYEFNYQADLDDFGMNGWGSLAFNNIGTWLDQLTSEPVPVSPLLAPLDKSYNCSGLYGLTCGTPNPKWRNKLRITWNTPWDIDFSAQWRFLGAVALDADTTNSLVGGGATAPTGSCYSKGVGDCFDHNIQAYNYFDFAGNWTVREGVSLRAGVNNIFDKEPPVIGLQAQTGTLANGNTFPGEYDALGRYIFVGATIKY